MSKVAGKLNYIFNWIESKCLDFSDYYNPGLNHQEIEDLIERLPFKISRELHDLYAWRNGTEDPNYNNGWCKDLFLFPENLFCSEPIAFFSLQDLIANYFDLYQASQETIGSDFEYEFWNYKWFPFASFENKRILYIIGDLDPSPVYLWDINCKPKQIRVYRNITSMLSAIAECCELEIYKLIPYEYGEDDEMIIRIDEDKLSIEKAIYQKYSLR